MLTPGEGTARTLEAALGGSVEDLRRLSGGASRTTSSFDLRVGGGTEPLILQQYRGDGVGRPGQVLVEAALLEAARERGVPVPRVRHVGAPGEGDAGWLVVERLEGESIPRKILRDPQFAPARAALTGQCARALAAIHRIDPDAVPGLAPVDPLRRPLEYLDALGEVRPALELGARWLEGHRPASGGSTTVHGDFRMGNLLVGPEGLRGVLDWELAHRGDPAEDLGWLCARVWRFGGGAPVGGFGELDELLTAYVDAGGEAMDAARVRYWEVYATLKWAVICALQASAHLSGTTRSIELAAIGRRVCESEWDLLRTLSVSPATPPPPPGPPPGAPFGRPSAPELLTATAGYLEDKVMATASGAARFEAMVARNVVALVEREWRLAPSIERAHRERLERLGVSDPVALAAAIRAGEWDDRFDELAGELCAGARDELLVANPDYLARDRDEG
jgi:aminoglycoside phosphotransferase (APT) family kinase protein